MEQDTWQPIGDVAGRLLEKLEDEQRRVFERECKRDGVYGRQRSVELREVVGHE